MSLVSTIATKDFITVVTDGRVTSFNNEIIREDYQKFIQISNTLFVGYAGDQKNCETFIKESKLLGVTNWESKDLSRYLKKKFACYKNKDRNVLIIIGGINRRNKIEFFTLDSRIGNDTVKYYLPKNEEIKYALLYNDVIDKPNLELYKKLTDIMKATEIKSIKDVVKAQIILNNYVSDNDTTVNKNIFKLIIKK